MCRVLVIDDEEDVLRNVRRRLERSGIIVATAGTSAEALTAIADASTPFDVIVTDMSMEHPESGLDVLKAAFARDIFAEVIVMTAYGNVANAVECMRRGAFDYIQKNDPLNDAYESLSDKVEDAMERRRQNMRTVGLWELAAKSREKVSAR